MSRGHHDPLTGKGAVTIEIGARRAGQHHAGAVVVGEHQGPFDGPGGQDHLFGADLPQPLTRRAGRRNGLMIGQALDDTDHVVREIAERRGAREHGDAGMLRQTREGLRDPIARRRLVDRRAALIGFIQQRSADLRLLVDQDDAPAALGRRHRRRQTGRPGADHQHLAMGKAVGVDVRIRRGGRPTQTGGGADDGFVQAAPRLGRPHEGLVVKPRRNEAADQAVHGADVERQVRPTILALGDEAVIQLYLGGAQIGRIARGVASDGDQSVRLVRSGAQNAARAMVFERSAGQPDAVGDQGRGEGIARAADVSATVEGEADRLVAVDHTAGRCAKGRGHGVIFGRGSPHL